MRNWQLRVDDVPDPTPGPGQVLTRVLACGICGSDLHMLQHGEESRRLAGELESDRPADPMAPKMFDPDSDMVMGHEFCCEVVDLGPGVNNLRTGDVVVSMPVNFDADGLHPLGFSNRYPGGYTEQMVLNELPVRSASTACPRRSPTSPIPTPTPRSSSSPEPDPPPDPPLPLPCPSLP
jgi:threonine dehydrogenase-like Zn-dependent dehydrogenase